MTKCHAQAVTRYKTEQGPVQPPVSACLRTFILNFYLKYASFGSRDCVVGITTSYGRGSNPVRARDFSLLPNRPDRLLSPTQPHIQWVSGCFPEGKAPWEWSWPLSSIKRRGLLPVYGVDRDVILYHIFICLLYSRLFNTFAFEM